MKNLCLWLCLIIVFYAPKLYAQDHLLPDNSSLSDTFNSYHQMLHDVFHEAYERDVLIKVIVIPSFQPEYVVYMKRVGGRYSLVLLRSELILFRYENLRDLKSGRVKVYDLDGNESIDYEAIEAIERRYPKDYMDVTIMRDEISIDSELAQKMIDVWRTHLLKVKYNGKAAGYLDGISFYFSMALPREHYSGHTHIANDSEIMSRLTSTVGIVVRYILGNKESDKADLIEALSDLD